MHDIQDRSGAKLTVQREEDMDATTKERFVDVVGTRSEQKVALELLLDLSSFCREDEGEVLKDIRSSAAAGSSGTVDTAAAKESKAPAEPPTVVEILPEDVGKVLGRKGETVKLLEQDSGAKIDLDKASGKVEILGPKEAQEKALELLTAEVSFLKEAGENGKVLKDRPDGASASDLPAPTKLWVRDREAASVRGKLGMHFSSSSSSRRSTVNTVSGGSTGRDVAAPAEAAGSSRHHDRAGRGSKSRSREALRLTRRPDNREEGDEDEDEDGENGSSKKRRTKAFAWMDSDDDEAGSDRENAGGSSSSSADADGRTYGGRRQQPQAVPVGEVQTLSQMLRVMSSMERGKILRMSLGELAAICLAAARTKYYDSAIFGDVKSACKVLLRGRGSMKMGDVADILASLADLNAFDQELFDLSAKALNRDGGSCLDSALRRRVLEAFKKVNFQSDLPVVQAMKMHEKAARYEAACEEVAACWQKPGSITGAAMPLSLH